MKNPIDAQTEAVRITLIGMALDLALGLGKIVGGIMSASFALVADGVHSLTDAVTDIFVLVIARTAYAAPDRGHPYGHGRFEAVGTIVMGIVFFITAAVLLYDASQRLAAVDELVVPGLFGAIIAAISIASKEWIYRFTLATAERLNSSLLRANAWHSRSDALSSIAVLIGIVGGQFGVVWLDTLAAMFVALLIAKIGWDLCSESIRELVDTALPDQRRSEFEDCLKATPGVKGLTDLRSRLSGGKAIVEVHLVVDPRISVSEGHQIGASASARLRENFTDVGEVIPHIDPQGNPDHDHPLDGTAVPSRNEVEEIISTRWREMTDSGSGLKFDLHYLEHGIEIDLIAGNADDAVTAKGLANQLINLERIIGIRVLQHIGTWSSNETRPRI